MIEVVDLKKTHANGFEALKGVSLSIAAGELVCLVGPSGCGKSTTLNLIAGLDAPTSGRVRVGGEDVTDRSPRERDLAMVFQSYALYPHLSVRDNLAFPLHSRGERDVDARVRETAALLGIEALLGRRPRELSGGQRQRVALGRALVRRPKAFLFDEPLSNLDAALRTKVRGEIKKLHERLKATFVYVTHDQAEAMTLGDRIAVMNEGRIEQVGTPRDVYDAPATEFVASLFGSISLLSPAALKVDRGARVGVRPEHVEVGLGAGGPLQGTVYLVEPAGAETFVTVELAGREQIVARAPVGFAAKSGDVAWVRVDPVRVLTFDAAGRRL